MNKKQYGLMNWEEIESIIYADNDHPKQILGVKEVKKEKLLQAFFPEAEKVDVVLLNSGKKTVKEMEIVDENGFYALFLTKNTFNNYYFNIYYKDKTVKELYDPYNFDINIDEKIYKDIKNGKCKDAYKYLGARKTTINSVKGYRFVVYAPNAYRISILGDWNNYDNRTHIMENLGNGFFGLFIPGLEAGAKYQYELKSKGTATVVKCDPFALYGDGTYSYTYENSYAFKAKNLRDSKADLDTLPLNIYECDLVELFKSELSEDNIENFVAYLNKLSYNAVKIMPLSPSDNENRDRYHVCGQFAISDKVSETEVKLLIDALHKAGIKVFMDIDIATFSPAAYGLRTFDGSNIFEHDDLRRSYYPKNNVYLFDYSRKIVSTYIYSLCNFVITEYNLDGVDFPFLALLIYLDYGKNSGDYLPNIHGGNMGDDAINFIRELNTYLIRKYPGLIKIASLDAVYPDITKKTGEGLKFDYVLNTGFKNEVINYTQADPYFRSESYEDLINSMQYMFNERFILPLSSEDTRKDNVSFFNRMPGTDEDKIKNARLTYALRMLLPGKKLTFMGIDTMEKKPYLNGEALYLTCDDEDRKAFNKLTEDANKLYMTNSLLNSNDVNAESFAFINNYDAKNNIFIFERKVGEEIITCICNFSGCFMDKYTLGVSGYGKYKEILNTDSKEYGGTGYVNKGFISSNEEEYDRRDYSITVRIPALSMIVLSYRPFTEKELEAIRIKKRKEMEKYVDAKIKEIIKERDEIIGKATEEANKKINELKKLLKGL